MAFSVDNGVSWIPIDRSYAGVPNSINFKVTNVNAVAPTIVTQPKDQTVASGGTVKFSVEAKSNGTGALTYQWQVNTSVGASRLGSFTVTAANASDFFSNVSSGIGGTSASYIIPSAVPEISGYRYRCVVSNDYGSSDTSAYAEVTVGSIAVMSHERTIPKPLNNGDFAVTAPTALTAEFKAGPNPTVKRGVVGFFRRGSPIYACELRVYDAVGNAVGRIKIRDTEAAGKSSRNNLPTRLVGTWDLSDAKGRQVLAGTYLVKGVITASDGKKEKVSIPVTVR